MVSASKSSIFVQMSNYIAYYFHVDPPQPGSDILIAALGELGFESFVENEEGFEAYISEEQENNIDLQDLIFEDFKFSFENKIICFIANSSRSIKFANCELLDFISV